jgi:hypothetical protein
MLMPLIYWIGLPLFCGWLVVRYIQTHSPLLPAPDVQDLYAENPIQPKRYRAARRGAGGLVLLGDFEKRGEAVEAAYAGKEAAQRAGEKAEFLVLDDQAALLEQVDS